MITAGIASVAFLLGVYLGGKGVLWKYATLGVAHPRVIEERLRGKR